jgi:hypothetical protein
VLIFSRTSQFYNAFVSGGPEPSSVRTLCEVKGRIKAQKGEKKRGKKAGVKRPQRSLQSWIPSKRENSKLGNAKNKEYCK